MELAFLTKVGNHDYTKKPVAKCFQLVLIGAKGPHPQHVLTVRALRPLSSRRDEECSSVSFGNTWNQEHEQEGTRNTWARSAASSSVTLIPKATLLFRRNKRNKRKQQRNNRAILLCSSQVRSRRKT